MLCPFSARSSFSHLCRPCTWRPSSLPILSSWMITSSHCSITFVFPSICSFNTRTNSLTVFPASSTRPFDWLSPTAGPSCTIMPPWYFASASCSARKAGSPSDFRMMFPAVAPCKTCTHVSYQLISILTLNFNTAFCLEPDECRDSRVFHVDRVFLRLC